MQPEMLKRLCLSLCMILVMGISVMAQQAMPSPAVQAANKLLQAQKWEEAQKAFEEIVKNEPNNGRGWYGLGYAQHAMGKHEKAVESFGKAVEILRGPVAMYNLACAYSKLNNKDKAFEWLNKAIDAGFTQPGQIEGDTDFANLHEDARFKEALTKVDKANKPCQYSPEARQLDFWVGEWDVQVNNQTIGTNVIKKLEEGCVILENWTAAGGGNTGKSMNFYNPMTKKWRQTYVGSGQGVWEMSGEYKDGAMRYEGELFNGKGKVMTRVTFYNQGEKVRHTQEDSNDNGQTWKTVFDATYVKKSAAYQNGDRAIAAATINGKKVSINYGRPSLNGRDMLGQAAAGTVWRLGKNEATEIETTLPISVAGKTLNAGKYTLWMKKTGDNDWVLCFHPQTGVWGFPSLTSGYVAELPLKMSKAGDAKEQLVIAISDNKGKGQIQIQWGTTLLNGEFAATN